MEARPPIGRVICSVPCVAAYERADAQAHTHTHTQWPTASERTCFSHRTGWSRSICPWVVSSALASIPDSQTISYWIASSIWRLLAMDWGCVTSHTEQNTCLSKLISKSLIILCIVWESKLALYSTSYFVILVTNSVELIVSSALPLNFRMHYQHLSLSKQGKRVLKFNNLILFISKGRLRFETWSIFCAPGVVLLVFVISSVYFLPPSLKHESGAQLLFGWS